MEDLRARLQPLEGGFTVSSTSTTLRSANRKLQTDDLDSVLGSNEILLGKEKYVAIVGGAGVFVGRPACG